MKSLKLIDRYRDCAQDSEVLSVSRLKEGAFTRKRKGGMCFSQALSFLLDLRKTTIQTRLNLFCEREEGGKPIKQPSFTKLRAGFDHTPFKIMVRRGVQEEYSGEYELPTWRGYNVFATDGSCLQLPQEAAVIKEFGVRGGKDKNGRQRAGAGISVLYDLLHGWVLDAEIDRANRSEREALGRHIDFLTNELPHIAENALVLLDRGYPSQEIFALLAAQGIHFCVRCTNDFTTEIRDAPMGDSMVALKSGQLVRIVKFVLKSGTVETLATNLFDLPEADFPLLYAMRWGVETLYHTLKKKVCVEKFSGKTPNSIRQDFWASMALLNVAATFQKEADDAVAKRHEGKQLKHSYRARNSDLIITLRDRFIFASLCGRPAITQREYDNIMRQLASVVSPVRPDRSFPRVKKPFAVANLNLKSVL